MIRPTDDGEVVESFTNDDRLCCFVIPKVALLQLMKAARLRRP